jgi:hypothetical protein
MDGELSPAVLAPLALRMVVFAASLTWLWASASRYLAGRHPGLASDDALLATATLSAAALTACAMCLGSVSLLSAPAWILSLVLAGVALRARAGGASQAPPGARAGSGPGIVFSVTLGAALLALALFALRNPPIDQDSLEDHLPMLAAWLQSGSLGIPVHVPGGGPAAYPGGVEILQLVTVMACGRDTFVPWPVVAARGLLVLALRRLALELGARALVAELLALALLAAPGVAAHGKGTNADLVIIGWLAIALRFSLRFRRGGAPADLGIALLALGLLSGLRLSSPAIAAGALLIVLLGPGRRSLRELRDAGAVAWLAAAGLGGFWLLRNTLSTGSPFFPVTVTLAGRTFEGLMDPAFYSRTTQIAVWREGFAGQLTPPLLLAFFGWVLPVILAGALIWLVLARRRIAEPERRRDGWLFWALAAWLFILFLNSWFSGANGPPGDGRPPILTTGNLRYLLPTITSLAPLAAAGLSAGPLLARVAAVPLAGAMLWGFAATGVRLPAGLGIAGIAALAWRGRPGPRLRAARTAGALILIPLGLAPVVSMTAPARDRIVESVWEERARQSGRPILPADAARRLRVVAGGRPIATVGVWYPFQVTGPDFAGHPIYVPVAVPGDARMTTWRLRLDDRPRARREQWLANLARARPALVAFLDEGAPQPERAWCAADTARFELLERGDHHVVYRVRAPALSRAATAAQ